MVGVGFVGAELVGVARFGLGRQPALVTLASGLFLAYMWFRIRIVGED